MIKLTEITGIEGFTARSIRYIDEAGYGTGVRHEWHHTADKDGNELEWLGETSSDEMVGHFYAYSNYFDLVADDEEKKLIASVVKRFSTIFSTTSSDSLTPTACRPHGRTGTPICSTTTTSGYTKKARTRFRF